MNKYAKVKLNNQIKWIEFYNDEIFFMEGDPLDNNFKRGQVIDEDLKFDYLAPSNPSKVIGVGWNYKDLVGERESYPEPIVFLKSPSSVCPHRSVIKLPNFVEKIWVETELVIIIGKQCQNVSKNDASKYILGYTIGSDITALNIHDRDWHLARSKAFDNFAPIGPYLVKNINTDNLNLKSEINDKEAQSGNTKDMILKDCELISLISSIMTLMPGDIIFTGTPARATEALVVSGDRVKHEVDNLGCLDFEVI